VFQDFRRQHFDRDTPQDGFPRVSARLQARLPPMRAIGQSCRAQICDEISHPRGLKVRECVFRTRRNVLGQQGCTHNALTSTVQCPPTTLTPAPAGSKRRPSCWTPRCPATRRR
jgi:hypothetical protein